MKMAELQKPKTVNKVVRIPVDDIFPNPDQPRKQFDREELNRLSISIKESGLLQPLTVRKEKDRYILISGERRLRAVKLAEMSEVDCIILDTGARNSAVLAVLENIQRCDLNFFEEAEALKNLMVEWSVSQIELGARLGKAQPTIANKLRLLKFNEIEREMILSYGINERQARALLALAGTAALSETVLQISKRRLNTAQTEKYVEETLKGKKPKKTFHPIIKDVRVFLNSINKAVNIMKESGVDAYTEQHEEAGYIEYVVRIPVS